MNNKQSTILATTTAGTLGAEVFIGGLGIGLLGTAVAVPASLVVATVGTLAYIAAGDYNSDNKSVVRPAAESTANTAELTSYLLKKGTVTHKISVNKERGWGLTCLQATSNASWTNYRHFSNLQELRDLYKTLLSKGYQPA
jgi:hypothetical protein